MDPEFRYELVKNRVADLHGKAAEYRRARQARDARGEQRRDGRWNLRDVLGRRRRS